MLGDGLSVALAGLLHDVGKLFILTVIDDIQHSDQMKVNPSAALLMEAMDDLHTTHGYALMHHWNLPEKYSKEAVREALAASGIEEMRRAETIPLEEFIVLAGNF